MSKHVTIPSNMNPWWCNINGVVYSYTAGSTQTVPDEVAAVIENYNNMLPKLEEPHKNKLYGTGSSGEPCLYDKESFEIKENVFYIEKNESQLPPVYTINGIGTTDVQWTELFIKMLNAWNDWIDPTVKNKAKCTILIKETASDSSVVVFSSDSAYQDIETFPSVNVRVNRGSDIVQRTLSSSGVIS